MRLSNYNILKEAEVPRIDYFIIKLIRNYIKKSINNRSNDLIFGPYYFKQNYFEKTLLDGFIPPECFQFLDNLGYIMNERLQPIFYHYSRDNRNKKILFDPGNICEDEIVYCRNVTRYDINLLKEFSYFNKK